MILDRIDLKQQGIEEKFKINANSHKSSWEHYFKNYNNALTYITIKGLEGNYIINKQSMAYLYIIRHTFELSLKYYLEQHGETPPITHNLSNICSLINPAITLKISQAINLINKDVDGSCYKYVNDKEGNPYWGSEILELLDVIKLCKQSEFSSLLLEGLSSEINWKFKNHIWEFTCHMNEVKTLGQLRTCYDFSITTILKGVANGEININDIYLPLLFLIRHSLEIALKFNLSRLQITTTTKTQKLIESSHSIESLYINYMSYLELYKSNLTNEIAEKYANLKQEYDHLNKIIHNLDTNSQAFRYPLDNNGSKIKLNLKPNMIYKIIELYYLTDSFTNYTVDVFRYNGIDI